MTTKFKKYESVTMRNCENIKDQQCKNEKGNYKKMQKCENAKIPNARTEIQNVTFGNAKMNNLKA